MANLLELAKRLRQERLFVRSEQESIHQLNKQVRLRSEQLSHIFWTTRQHHLNLNHFITNSSQGVPVLCAQRVSHLDNIKFVDAYKELGYQESMYGNFLHAFRSNPTLAAACLAYGEKLALESTMQVVQSVVLGIYGNSIISGDHRHLLELIETLLLLQLANEDQPRRVLQKGNSAFCTVYRLFTESLLAGRLFLTSALHKPVMQVLMEDELYLERDSKKILDCFSKVDIEKRFGKRDDPEFENRVKKHLEWTEDRFYEICQSFIDSLHAAMFCFPQSMGWVIARAYHIVKEAGLVSLAEATALCADMMLQMFIGPAIITPELHGVTGDAPISELTRFNLMQIAQTLQVLVLMDENTWPNNSFYNRFEKNCMSSILDAVISTWHTDGVPSAVTTEHSFKDCTVFLTCTQLAQLIQLLREIQFAEVRGVDQSSLAVVLSHLPDNPPTVLAQALVRKESSAGASSHSDQAVTDGDNNTENNRDGSNGSSGSGGHPSPMPSRSSELNHSPSASSSKKLFSKSIKTRGKSVKLADSPHVKRVDISLDSGQQTLPKSGSGSGDSLQEDSKAQLSVDPEVVLVISLTGASGTYPDPPGMLSENEILEMQTCHENNVELNSASDAAAPDPNTLDGADSERMDKRLRFSLYSTDLSELGEEAMSSTSGSSMEDMDPTESVQADDTSSFRGTSSHGNQDEDFEMEEEDLESAPHTNNDEALKALERKLPTSRESIEDKMRKFEIRPQLGVRFGGAVIAELESEEGERGETGHLSGTVNYLDTRSETWSTDVYASDSETATEQGDPPEQLDRLQEIAENPDPEQGQLRGSSTGPYLSLLPRDEDSRSDVWSVEVLPSDSEPPDVKPEDRLQELESESTTGQEDQIDQLEDNRSRASTPGLSAASGVSGTSGMSLVSDNIQAKGGEEHGSSSERSYGKTPSSISPDADDLIVSHRGPGSGPNSSRMSAEGSSHSSGSGEGAVAGNYSRPQTAPTATSMHSLLLETQQSVIVSGEDNDSSKRKAVGVKGLMKRSQSASSAHIAWVGSEKVQPISPVSMPSGANHLNWPLKKERLHKNEETTVDRRHKSNTEKYFDSDNLPLTGTVPEAASTPDKTISSVLEMGMEPGNTNTIKRSPYKQNDSFTTYKDSAFNSVPASLARDLAAESSNSNQLGYSKAVMQYTDAGDFQRSTGPIVNHIKTNGILPGTLSTDPSITASSFMPITSASTYSPTLTSPCDISSFDPLVTSAPSAPLQIQSPIATGNNLLNVNSMSAALVDLSLAGGPLEVSRGIDQHSQIPSPVTTHAAGARSKNGHLTKHGSLDLDSRGVERKKSWWKSPRIPVLSGKRKTVKSSPLQISKEEPIIDLSDGYMKTPGDEEVADSKAEFRQSSNVGLLGEDIMEKYMRKAASNQSSPRLTHSRDAPVPSASVLSTLSENLQSSSNGHDSSKFTLDDTIPADRTMDSQNPNSSSTTDPQSTPSNVSSDQTVTTVTQGTSLNLSPPTPDKPAKAVPLTCQLVKTEYNPEPAQLITDAQRKLRLMLSTSESLPESSRFSGLLPRTGMEPFGYHGGQHLPQNPNEGGQMSRNNARAEIISFLRLQLAEAVNLQNHSRIAQIHETTRCVQVLDAKGCKELLQNLWREYKQRSAYIAYLVRTKQTLLTMSSYLQRLFRCTERDQETCRRYLTTVFVTLFLKRMEDPLKSFKMQFTCATAADEKVSLVRSFLSWLYGQMSRDRIWQSASEEQLREAERAIERSVFVYIYKLAIYPNGDGDVMRDQLFYEHIARLSEVITSQHPTLLVAKKYLNECPWPSAQAQAKSVNAYKTPRDKLTAVLRCCNTIMNLLKMADEGTVPGADDFTPVLVYVLIKANPTHLLSTVQYITSFLGDELTGEDSYWWMQFTAATEFIKTIDERK